jgi:hypothetical protein
MRSFHLISLSLLALAGAANADWYSCKDPRFGGDSPPATCSGEICVTKANGARTCTLPPETPQQRQKREAAEKARRECEKKARDKLHDDYRFLDKYRAAEDIQAERYRALADQQRLVDSTNERIRALNDERQKLNNEKEFYKTHPMPEELRRDIESIDRMSVLQQRQLASQMDAMEKVNDRYDAMLSRYQDLKQNGVGPSPCDPKTPPAPR